MTGALSKADLYTKPWLQAIAAEHGYGGSAGTSAFPVFGTAYDQWNVGAGTTGVTATARADNKAQIFIGQSGSDTFTGGSKDDVIFAGAGNDTLDGKGGNDKLYGGAGNDTYNFTDTFGKDTIIDSDGLGQIKIGDKVVGTAKGAGKRNVWVAEVGAGQYVGMSVYDDQSSATGKKLVITRADSTDNTITINNFDLDKALSRAGYLGIKLDPTQRVALVQGTGSDVGASTSNVWADNTFKASSLEGQSSEVVEANGKSFNIYLAQAAHACAQRQRRVSLKSADTCYRIRSCLRPCLRGYGPIWHKKHRALQVSNASVCRVIMTCGMCA